MTTIQNEFSHYKRHSNYDKYNDKSYNENNR